MTNSRIFQRINKIDLAIIANAILLALVLWWTNSSNLDVEIQNHFFDFNTKSWLIDRNEPVKKFIFYNFPKIIFGVGIFGCAIFSILGFVKKSQFFFKNRHKFFLAFLGLVFIPLIAGNIKKFTNTYCPTQLEIYDGSHPYVKIFQPDFEMLNGKKGKCFPAGHAVTGFALMILFFIFEKKSYRYLALVMAITLGWVLGFYQIMKGAHFFSDTVVAMLVCFILAAIIARIYRLENRL